MKKRTPNILVFALLFLLNFNPAYSSQFMLGVDVFLSGYTHLVRNHRVGLITNQTGKDRRGVATVDLLFQHPNINLVALFAPEHGIRGDLKAGELVKTTTDRKTNLPVYSLYSAEGHRPSQNALDQVDTIIYDIQDVGSRAYTFIWSMAEAMEAIRDSAKNFIVFDRPNPLSCGQVDGPITEDKWLSFIGLYPIPRVYGMTVGELARYLNAEHRLSCKLVIIPMAAYSRNTKWSDINLSWVPPSPNIPSTESAICFAATGTIGELGNVHIGIGTQTPFQIIGAPWLNASHAAQVLNRRKLPGVGFQSFRFRPKTGLFKGKNVNAIKLTIKDVSEFLPSRTEVYILEYLLRHYADQFKFSPLKYDKFDKAMGTSTVRLALKEGVKPELIVRNWSNELDQFRIKSKPYFIY